MDPLVITVSSNVLRIIFCINVSCKKCQTAKFVSQLNNCSYLCEAIILHIIKSFSEYSKNVNINRKYHIICYMLNLILYSRLRYKNVMVLTRNVIRIVTKCFVLFCFCFFVCLVLYSAIKRSKRNTYHGSKYKVVVTF